MIELSDYVPINLICLGLLGALGLRRLVRIERFHRARVVMLTGLLWVPTLYLFSLALAPQVSTDCAPLVEEPNVYTISE